MVNNRGLVKSKPHPSEQMASSFGVENMVRIYHQYKAIWNAQVGKQLFPFFLKYQNNTILRAEATKIMSPSATCTNQWAWLVAGGRDTKYELIVRG